MENETEKANENTRVEGNLVRENGQNIGKLVVAKSPRGLFTISFWGAINGEGAGEFESFRVYGNKILTPRIGAYFEEGVDFKPYKGKSNVPPVLRKLYPYVAEAFKAVGGNKMQLLSTMQNATYLEGDSY
jgi:hypothetical protein